MDTQDRAILRLMAWERVKGELKSILQTYAGEYVDVKKFKKFKKFKKTIETFIKNIEEQENMNNFFYN